MRKWTEEEVQYLEDNWGTVSIKYIAKKVNRTENAVILKAKRQGLGGTYSASECLTANLIANILKIDVHTVTDYWIPKCNLKGNKKTLRGNASIYQIKLDDLIKWLKNNKDKWNASKVELYALGIEPEWLKEKRKIDSTAPERRNYKWTKEEENKLISCYKLGLKQKEISKQMNRSVDGIERKINRLKKAGKIPMQKIVVPWTEEENKILFKMDRKGKTDEEIAWELGREWFHVADHRRYLKNENKYPSKSKRDLIRDTRIKKVLKLRNQGFNNSEIAKKLGVHYTTISRNLQIINV
ncbi:helix-turn-helix domain-containing protein [Clostridium botulinum]|uniref:Phage protein n=1 Tax=Clostridium botulinum CFSAN001627 TaxID=1232189 RepID=M1ZZD8_CLOBO|nr:helix-turn-helix domain-containing protein [Clostridium botulinum]EKN42930.1 phage protein [Clostridium botulinum CFSAN001627]AXG97787.1 helix-turn-helix domain-containing protein [Clostridium botulinum]MBY6773567.1 helix-turn-helix domain-containing protein [Clostridium botulinum]MBY6850403.1 helix-turn-helix domain-containing protein [Clostridium botulinum]MBY6857463.1 helix-turn-helix domain-containing protein [Clostridium botulinum]